MARSDVAYRCLTPKVKPTPMLRRRNLVVLLSVQVPFLVIIAQMSPPSNPIALLMAWALGVGPCLLLLARQQTTQAEKPVASEPAVPLPDPPQLQFGQNQRLEAIGQLAAGIAHEINTPTQYVSDNVRFLETEFANLMSLIDQFAAQLALNAPAKSWAARFEELNRARSAIDFEYVRSEVPQAISQSLEGLKRISTIVSAMKDFSHPGSGGKEPADLNRSINATIEVCRNRWKYVCDLETDLAADLPEVPCLIAEIGQVVLNLIVNAADAIAADPRYSHDCKGMIRVTSCVAGEHAEIRVCDNGPGIPPDAAKRIFEPFFTTKPIGQGTGQGLALSRTIVITKHNGDLRFETEPGVGTTFIIRLPLGEARDQDKVAAAA